MANCEKCGGCGRTCPSGGSLELTRPELDCLNLLAQLAFLPVARRADEMLPHGFPDSSEMTLVLQCLEKKQLISIDYHGPLKGFDYASAPEYPVHGSCGLTERGQGVLDLIAVQGVKE